MPVKSIETVPVLESELLVEASPIADLQTRLDFGLMLRSTEHVRRVLRGCRRASAPEDLVRKIERGLARPRPFRID
ncbi:MAG: hypothetical protein R3190_07660 [Thermoanaerobaculia bacterium]|nr:hypothetical protein [Thermoanaerobaculia bacterium]